MKKILLLLLMCSSAACVPASHRSVPQAGPYARLYPYPYARPEAMAVSVMDRWDNVMLLPAGTPVHVLMMDGRQARGEMVSADATRLTVLDASGEVDFGAADVMRVDRLPRSETRDVVEAAGRGAALGAGFVGVIGLVAGRIPLARLFAAGAIMGAAQSTEHVSMIRGPVMIYLARPQSRRQEPEAP